MKKSIFLTVLMLSLVSICFAAMPTKAKKSVFERGSVLALTSGGTIYSVVFTGVTAGDILCLYDSSKAIGIHEKLPFIDIKMGTANDSKDVVFASSMGKYFDNGVYGVVNGDVNLDHGNLPVWEITYD